MRSARPVFKVRDRDRDWAGTVSTSETETLIHEYSRLRQRPGKCVFSRSRVSLISALLLLLYSSFSSSIPSSLPPLLLLFLNLLLLLFLIIYFLLLILLIFVYPNMELWREEQDIGTNCPELGTNERTDRQRDERTDRQKKRIVEVDAPPKNLGCKTKHHCQKVQKEAR